MVKSRRIVMLLVFGLGLLVSVWAFAGASVPTSSGAGMQIAAQPSSGAAGTVVTITGQGAAPNAPVAITGGYRQYAATCPSGSLGRPAQGAIFAQTSADATGDFSASFQVLPDGGAFAQAYFTAFSPGTADGLATLLCFDIVGQARTFPETGKTLRGRFLTYWDEHGGAAQFGYPISDEFEQVLEDGRSHRVQYFAGARFESRPELPKPYDVRHSQVQLIACGDNCR